MESKHVTKQIAEATAVVICVLMALFIIITLTGGVVWWGKAVVEWAQ